MGHYKASAATIGDSYKSKNIVSNHARSWFTQMKLGTLLKIFNIPDKPKKDDIRWIILPEKEKAIDNEILGAYIVFKLENIS